MDKSSLLFGALSSILGLTDQEVADIKRLLSAESLQTMWDAVMESRAAVDLHTAQLAEMEGILSEVPDTLASLQAKLDALHTKLDNLAPGVSHGA